MSSPQIIFGSHQVGEASDEELQRYVEILKKNNIKTIDTAKVYGESEKRLGDIEASKSFVVDTKSPSMISKPLSRDNLTTGIDESLALLKTKKVDVYYLHTPDDQTPIEETVDTIQELHRQGKFARGIVPTVYQGNYNAFARSIEQDLFPLLRELGLSSHAYSPLAGGLFAKNPSKLATSTEAGRSDISNMSGHVYNALYNKPSVVEALRQWQAIAKDIGDTSIGLAYRWILYHSALDAKKGDAVIVGAGRPAQLEQTLEFSKGSKALEKDVVVEKIDVLWKLVEADAPRDNYNSWAKENLTAEAFAAVFTERATLPIYELNPAVGEGMAPSGGMPRALVALALILIQLPCLSTFT
ncbi:hypothetical protein CBER1_08477 [Cercospora berteroae]|uniref:NADP-dependent oxidoreductase domain-containing protein n=1 Tax=Cercospora berteroae TaxID=357750 RepID=A0A2S6BVU2_9PEZI|nr:hypothetical protein CBER1_08477 [Cercospora berteroae]